MVKFLWVDYEIIPLLQEYWFDEPQKVQKLEGPFKGSPR